jgi:hypothetical protein
MMKKLCNKKYRSIQRRGFWIMESTIAIAVIGIGVVAVVGSQQAWHIQAVVSDRLATGMRLAIEIRELSLLLPANDPVTGVATWGSEPGEILPDDLDDLDDLDGVTFATPIDATRSQIVGMSGWTQEVSVQCVNPFNVLQIVSDGASEVVQMEVVVECDGEEITRLSWISPR